MPASDLVVFSAHAADFCSRAGGMIALSARAGLAVHVVDLTFGERGESEDYWARASPGGLAEACRVREAEAREAAGVLGASIEFLDFGDYPLYVGPERVSRLAAILRERRPATVVTHWDHDPYNVDHEETARAVRRAASIAAVPGFDPASAPAPYPALFAFEPTIPRDDDTGFRPNHYVVIDDVFDLKMRALAALRSQTKLAKMYTQWGEYRGAQARQWSGRTVRFAEAYYRHTAVVADGLAGA
jgi:4-oxalomesaconate hydratase